MKEITIKSSGTLGDSYCIFCKMYGAYEKNPNLKFNWKRYSKHQNFDNMIKKIINKVNFINSYKSFQKEELKITKDDIYLDVWSNGINYKTKKKESYLYQMYPYPNLNLKKPNLKKGFNVGIQLHSGKNTHNFKGFDVKWLKNLINEFKNYKDINFYLFGVGNSYNLKNLEKFCRQNNITNLVGKSSFEKWLDYMGNMNYFITPEGFSAFFSMSQKVPCYIYYVIEKDLDRVHKEWKKTSKFEEVQSKVKILDSILNLQIIQRINSSQKVFKEIKREYNKRK